jgi:hypothetical protein
MEVTQFGEFELVEHRGHPLRGVGARSTAMTGY